MPTILIADCFSRILAPPAANCQATQRFFVRFVRTVTPQGTGKTQEGRSDQETGDLGAYSPPSHASRSSAAVASGGFSVTTIPPIRLASSGRVTTSMCQW